ncbi:hypothetical protein D3C80_646030 [compost metagenome]
MTIEIYVDNYERPDAVTETVNRLEIDYQIEHADSVSCITVANEDAVSKLDGVLTVIHRRVIHG